MAREPAGHLRGAVLLEVLLSIVLFAAAAGTIMGGLISSMQGVQGLQIEAQAADLAVTLHSQIQMGQVPATSDGPNDYAVPLDDWCWQVLVADMPSADPIAAMQQVQITITHKPTGRFHRLAWLIASPNASTTGGGQ